MAITQSKPQKEAGIDNDKRGPVGKAPRGFQPVRTTTGSEAGSVLHDDQALPDDDSMAGPGEIWQQPPRMPLHLNLIDDENHFQ